MAYGSRNIWMVLFLGTLVRYSDMACTYTEQTSTKANQGTIKYIESTSKEACQDFCTARENCSAADYHTTRNYCLLYDSVPITEPDVSFTHLVKSCVPDPDSNPCSMTRTTDIKGGTTNVQLSLTSNDHCSSVCLYMTECQGVSFTGGTCNIYTGSPSATNSGDDLTHVKHSCQSGSLCCMTGTASLKASDAAFMTLTSSLESCETFCMTSNNCHSVYFRNNVCYVYTSQPTMTSETGSTYSEKSCTGTPANTVTITQECYGATGTRPSQEFLFVVVAILLYMFHTRIH